MMGVIPIVYTWYIIDERSRWLQIIHIKQYNHSSILLISCIHLPIPPATKTTVTVDRRCGMSSFISFWSKWIDLSMYSLKQQLTRTVSTVVKWQWSIGPITAYLDLFILICVLNNLLRMVTKPAKHASYISNRQMRGSTIYNKYLNLRPDIDIDICIIWPWCNWKRLMQVTED